MSYAGFSLKNFSSRFILVVRIAETRTADLGRRRRRTVHRASLARFLIFCKIMSSKPPASKKKAARFNPKGLPRAALRPSPPLKRLGQNFGDSVELRRTCERR